MDVTDLPVSGIYRHYKGPLYQVLGLAHDANHDGRICVVYIALSLNPEHLGPRLAVRTVEDFTGFVNHVDVESRYMYHGPRFTYLGPILTPLMLDSEDV